MIPPKGGLGDTIMMIRSVKPRGEGTGEDNNDEPHADASAQAAEKAPWYFPQVLVVDPSKQN
jgi:hypothetical protein